MNNGFYRFICVLYWAGIAFFVLIGIAGIAYGDFLLGLGFMFGGLLINWLATKALVFIFFGLSNKD